MMVLVGRNVPLDDVQSAMPESVMPESVMPETVMPETVARGGRAVIHRVLASPTERR
jgi:hypothetical protein